MPRQPALRLKMTPLTPLDMSALSATQAVRARIPEEREDHKVGIEEKPVHLGRLELLFAGHGDCIPTASL